MDPVCSRKSSGALWGRSLLDVLVVAVLFAGGTVLGRAAVETRYSEAGLTQITCPDDFFNRSVMIAAGRGSVYPDANALPALRAFLDRHADSFDASTLPAMVPLSDSSAADYHIYLVWTVGLVWRIFGISWPVLEYFLALGLGLCAVLAYGFFRLGMNRFLSAAGAVLYVSSPAVLGQVNNLRDFFKAPFLLAGILAIGWLVTRRRPQRFLPAAIVAMGLVAGIGMGFRQDQIILVPAALAAILVLSPRAVFGSLRKRTAMAVLFLTVFFAAAWPMFVRMEGGAQPFHPVAQGYSMGHMRRCALEPGPCEPLANAQDGFVYDTVLAYARSATGNGGLDFWFDSPQAARFTREWVVATALQFPADTLARLYGTTLNVLADAENYLESLRSSSSPMMAGIAGMHRHLGTFLRMTGPFFAVAALLAVAAANIRLGVALFLFFAYFCGYVSLDNEWRHTFHLSFVPFWTVGLTVQCVLVAAAHARAHTGEWAVWRNRAALFAVFVVAATVIPWQLARVWQHHNVGEVLNQYVQAPKTPVRVTPTAMRDWTLFATEETPDNGLRQAEQSSVEVAAGGGVSQATAAARPATRRTLYAVCFSGGQSTRIMMAKYKKEGMANDFTQLLRTAKSLVSGGNVWFYFPAYTGPLEHFEGVAVPAEDADDLLGLYRVEEKGLPALLPCATLQEGNFPTRLCARIAIPVAPLEMNMPEAGPPEWRETARLEENLGHAGDALLHLRACNAVEPSRQGLESIIALCDRRGYLERELEGLKELVKSEGDFAACEALDRFLTAHMQPQERLAIWEFLVSGGEVSGQVWFRYGAMIMAADPDRAVPALREAVKRLPGDRNAVQALHQALTRISHQTAHLVTRGIVS